MNRKWTMLALAAGVVAIPVLAKLGGGTNAVPVETEIAALREVKASILASGSLVYEQQALLSPEVIGRVEKILVKEGDQVTPGQIVLKLDEKSYRAQVEQQQAAVQQQRIAIEQQVLSIANQERLFQHKKELYESNFVSHEQLDDARFAVDAARIEVKSRQESLLQAEASLSQSSENMAKTDIRSPIAGTVIAVDIKVGETAVPSSIGIAGSTLMTIANTQTILSEINVDEADIAKVKVGQEVSIHVGAFPDQALKGIVRTLPLASNRNGASGGGALSRAYVIKASVEYPAGLALRPGMTCRAEIFTSTASRSIAVPIQAVLSASDDADTAGKETGHSSGLAQARYVMVDVDGVSARRTVTTGLSDDSYQEITSGLKAGDRIIVGPYKMLRYLHAGQALKPDAVASAAMK